MGLGKWISGWLGFCMGGPLGAFAGFALGWLLEKSMSGQDDADYTQQERERMLSDMENTMTYSEYKALIEKEKKKRKKYKFLKK